MGNNNSMDLGVIELGGMYWIGLSQDRNKWRALVNAVMNLRVSQNSGKFLSCCTIDGLPRSAQPRGVSQLIVRGLTPTYTDIQQRSKSFPKYSSLLIESGKNLKI
jgi:hypothetical protein